ncbi:MAG TPA: hypothetical protein DCF63_08020 [Planctomycetaceae bacterium]|nr:hypothetical protein [Planctomycetaceae bacterium]
MLSVLLHERGLWIAVLLILSMADVCRGQSTERPTTVLPPTALGGTQPNSSGTQTQGSSDGWVVRDPATGKLYHQRLVNVTVPSVRWESKQITTTIQQPQWVNQVVPRQQVTYRPETRYVPRGYWKGAWNPFGKPKLVYDFVPVTNWVANSVTVNQVITTQKWVPEQQTITVPHLVTDSRVQQQLVQTEIPQSQVGTYQSAAGPNYRTAYPPPILGTWNLLARRSAASPWPATGYQLSPTSSPYQKVPSVPAAPNQAIATFSSPTVTGLRPMTRSFQNVFPPSYNVPMQTASRSGGTWDSTQSVMPATVLR